MKVSSLPNIYRNINRWRAILTILSKYGLASWIGRFDASFGKGILKSRSGDKLAMLPKEQRIRLALEELGPAFVKLGQILSTRPDQVGAELAEELTHLQADTKADAPEVVRALIEQELQKPIDTLFASFDDIPIASASIGQVHAATLHSGEDVVVKVQHYDIEKNIRVDLDILLGLAQFAEKVPELAPYRPCATVEEFRRVMKRELDFSREERNLCAFARDFATTAYVYIPKSYPAYSTKRVLTMERLRGKTFATCCEGDVSKNERKELASRGANVFLEMIFRHGFYHADPHPGNLVILPNNVIGLLDFGMVGRIGETLREDMEDLLTAILTRDSIQLTSLVMRMGAAPIGLDEMALAVELSDFVAFHGNQPMMTFNLSAALQEMLNIIRRYQIALPTSMAMLMKVMIMLEGTGRKLEPDFSLMELIEPYQKRIFLQRLSPKRHAKKLRRITYELEHLAELLPRRLREILQQMQAGKFDVHLDHRGLEPSVNRLVLGMLTSALFLGSSVLLSSGVGEWHGFSVPGVLGYLISSVLGLRLLRAISKSGHLDRRK